MVIEDRHSDGREKVLKDSKLEALFHEDSCQTQEELAGSMGVTQQTISKCLKTMGIIQKQGNWVPYDLKPRDVERRLFACEQLLERQRPNIHSSKVMLCTWWDQLGVVYYELLKPSETITGDLYRKQLMRLSQVLKDKRPQRETR